MYHPYTMVYALVKHGNLYIIVARPIAQTSICIYQNDRAQSLQNVSQVCEYIYMVIYD